MHGKHGHAAVFGNPPRSVSAVLRDKEYVAAPDGNTLPAIVKFAGAAEHQRDRVERARGRRVVAFVSAVV